VVAVRTEALAHTVASVHREFAHIAAVRIEVAVRTVVGHIAAVRIEVAAHIVVARTVVGHIAAVRIEVDSHIAVVPESVLAHGWSLPTWFNSSNYSYDFRAPIISIT
jgi:hypothetical protein